MGVIKRQGIKFSIVNYIGVVIGALSTLFLYPYDKEVYGLFRFVLDSANLFAPFIMLGTAAISIRYFHKFRDYNRGHNGFLFLLILVCAIGCVIFILFTYFGWDTFIEYFKDKKSSFYQQFLWIIIPLSLLYTFINLFRSYCSNFGRIVVPSLLDQSIKFTFPILLILYISKIIQLNWLMYGVILNFVLYLIVLIFYTNHLGHLHLRPKFSFLNRNLSKEIFSYGLFGIMGSAGSMLALRIDTFMVGTLKELSDTGIYSIAALIAANIAVPITAVSSISAPIISKAWQENNLGEIKMIYKKSSINLLIVGLLFFMGIWLNIDDIFKIMPKGNEMQIAKYVVFWIGMSKLFDMATGVNDIITAYSKYYRFNFYTIVLMAIINIIGNIILIPIYGSLGAAIATASSSIIYNFIKYLYIKYKLMMTPFSSKTLLLAILSLAIYYLISLIHFQMNPYISIVSKGLLLSGMYIPLIYYFRISEDINEIIDSILKSTKSYF
ncbi:MAG TPA: oligosaccharide flippase family protein [Saprospiraceae bacterium]|nr:oligosaccharide flippase family protein [Saprospiraceae bacterium]